MNKKLWIPLLVLIAVLIVWFILAGIQEIGPGTVPKEFNIKYFNSQLSHEVTSSGFGGISIYSFNVGFDSDEICITPEGEVISRYKGEETSLLKMGEIQTEETVCSQKENGKVTFRFEGLGHNKTKISLP